MNSDFEDLEYKDEWEALQVTYPELNLPREPPLKGTTFELCIQIDLNRDYTLNIITGSPGTTTDHDRSKSEGLLQISHLPPIYITLLLPSLYPSEEPPRIISLWSTHNWLPNNLIEKLIQDLQKIWDQERSVILALWIDHIRDGKELLESLGLLDNESDTCILSHTQADDLLSSLRAYNHMAKETNFNNDRYRCPVCFDRLQGTECISLFPCKHVACKKCLKDGWSLYIAEGRSELVSCPDPQCIKLGRSASIHDVRIVLSPQEVVRWQWLVRKKELEKDPSIVFCPQMSCQRPVKKEPPLDGRSPEWERLRQCECGFTFCVYCRRTWHGPHLACPLPSSADFIKKYIELPLGSPERLVLEKRYGKSNLIKLVAKYREDQLNRAWMESQTMPCPGCQVRVQKNMGCNHMTCSKCGSHFCYRCGAKLKAGDPYVHFSMKGHPCYSKLFEGVQNEDVWMELDVFEQ